MTLNPSLPSPPVGWPLLPFPDADGQLHFPDFAGSVRENLRVILSTRPGEQLLRPEYGAGLADFLHEPDTMLTRRRIRDRVTEAITKWERRIELDRVEVADVTGQPGRLRIEIAYRLRRTGELASFGVSLELES